ncbi:TonB family protein [Erythrobacter arachoides]|uniref:TonB family protein n=1 Tax=Aurantiacibacter arachoides TaxID=1850444 RepID=A0A845A345_9SPHN|nr:TonB family protein [Aurantiacibacter arachoides]MXO93566.1 TonB family protein [Aurantiacibacter arachoides]GGD48386.1 hypothetical protein GCM10011411_05150 [Aurantiacibacter arachoides]
MSYANAIATPADRAKAAVSVIAIHALVGFGIVTGLTVTGAITIDDETLVGIDLTDPLPPPPPPPEPIETATPDVPVAYLPRVAPKPPMELAPSNPITVAPITDRVPRDTFFVPGPTVDRGPVVAPRPSPSPSPVIAPVAAIPRNGPAGWFTNDDYPRRELTRESEGTARYRLIVGTDGRVDACEITAGTGHAGLDTATCRLIQTRARFDAATNASGERVVGTYTGSVSWQIPE